MPCSLTLSRANLSTNTLKACAKPKDVINELLDGLENFFRVRVASHELQQPQMIRDKILYRLEIHSFPLHAFSLKSIKHRLNQSPPSV
jgi:hypothetical protein